MLEIEELGGGGAIVPNFARRSCSLFAHSENTWTDFQICLQNCARVVIENDPLFYNAQAIFL